MAAQWYRDGVIFTQNELNRMGITEPETLGFVVLIDEVPIHDSFETKMVKTGEVIDGKVVYVEMPMTEEEILAKLKNYSKRILRQVDVYINTAVCTIKGYEEVDSIGKYLVSENPFYKECKEISLWIASCYIKCYEIENNVIAKTMEIPTIETVIGLLPIPEFLTAEEYSSLNSTWKRYLPEFSNEVAVTYETVEA